MAYPTTVLCSNGIFISDQEVYDNDGQSYPNKFEKADSCDKTKELKELLFFNPISCWVFSSPLLRQTGEMPYFSHRLSMFSKCTFLCGLVQPKNWYGALDCCVWFMKLNFCLEWETNWRTQQTTWYVLRSVVRLPGLQRFCFCLTSSALAYVIS